MCCTRREETGVVSSDFVFFFSEIPAHTGELVNAECSAVHSRIYLALSNTERGGHGSATPESTPAGFWIFLGPDPESIFRKNRLGVTFYFWQ